MSERLGPQQMLGILNDYFTRMAAIVERHGGVVDKYVGDALMALFGDRSPLPTTRTARYGWRSR